MTANVVLTIINQGKFISSYDRETIHVNWREAHPATSLVPLLSPHFFTGLYNKLTNK